MTGRSKTEVLKEERDTHGKDVHRFRFSVPVGERLISTDEPERYLRSVLAAQGARLRQRPGNNSLRWHTSSTSSLVSKTGGAAKAIGYYKPARQVRTQLSVSNSESSNPRAPSIRSAVSETLDHDIVRLPPIMQNMRVQTSGQSLPGWSSIGGNKTKSNSLKSKLGVDTFESNGVSKCGDSNSFSDLLNESRTIIPRGGHIVKAATKNGTISEATFSEQIKRFKRVSGCNTLSDRRGLNLNTHTVASEASTSIDDVFLEAESSSNSKKRKKSFRIFGDFAQD